MNDVRIKPADLINFASAVLRSFGVTAEDAALVADSLVQADLWGHQSHGTLRLPWYAARLRNGVLRADAIPEPVLDGGAVLVLDGHHGLGQVIAETARREAVARARQYGVGVVGVRNSNHFGTAMYYTRRAAQDGCVAILTTNASPAMAPWGGKKKVLGSNPWSIAAPAPTDGGAVAVDLSNTAVARGKIYLARNRGETIPDSWALDSNGNATTDPTAALEGLIQPIAGHKGYAITFMMDILSGALTGSQTGTRVNGPYQADKYSGAGHLMVAINADSLGPSENYLASVRQLIDEVKSAPLADGAEEIFYPGEVEERNEAASLAAGGVLLPELTRTDLEKLAAETSVPMPV